MWINAHVNLPGELITAQGEGRLVIFAGAGISKGFPSNFPDFEGLADEVMSRSAQTLIRGKAEPVDHFFGRLKKKGVRVHQIVREILTRPDAKPTKLHYELLSLFRNPQEVRVVTTNFDRHFSTAASELFGDNKIPVYWAPALPLGHRFNGIVYLHGCVDQEAEELILTDGDFGRAYLTEGWATGFLKGLFGITGDQTFTTPITNTSLHKVLGGYVVLFVGYSHNDQIMEYIGRSLPPKSLRFALVPEDIGEEEREKWKLRGIEPILYPHTKEDINHQALIEAVEAWATRTKMGLIEHEQRIKEIVQNAPPTPIELEKVDYILETLRDPARARIFSRYAKTPEWLRWVEEKNVIKPLFMLETTADDLAPVFADWFTDKFALDHAEEALAVVHRQGLTFSPVLWWRIAHALTYPKQPLDSAVLGKWVSLLLQSIPQIERRTRDILSIILDRCRYPQDITTALLLFRKLTEPMFILEPHIPLVIQDDHRKVNFEITIPGEFYWLERAWNGLFKSNLNVLADELEAILTAHLREAHRLVCSVGSADNKWDPMSFSRIAIEPHEQDEYPRNVDVLINAARDVLEWLVANNHEGANKIIEEWAASDVPLLKRLAVHGIRVCSYLQPDEKLGWLLEKGFLFAYGLKHEVFQLLKTAYLLANGIVRQQLLDQAEQYLEYDKDDERKIRPYEVYNLVVWLNQVAPDCTLAAGKLQELSEKYPDFKPREHPDLDRSISVDWHSPQSPLTTDELLARPPHEIVEFLLTYQGEEFFGPDREGLLYTLKEAVAKSFTWGWKLVEELKARGKWTTDLWGVIIQGWQFASKDAAQWEQVLELLKSHPELLRRFGYKVAELFLSGVKDERGLPVSLLGRAEACADLLFITTENEAVIETEDWWTRAINHVGGKLTEFWLHALARHRKEKGNGWVSLPEEYKNRFACILSGQTVGAEMGRVLLASQLHFLFALDSDWTRENIIPLLDWSGNPRIAEQAWHGYLFWGKWSEAYLPELLPLYEQASQELPAEPEKIRERLYEHLANIA
ncbi:SIR2 family NAD-dependent protein deacylase [Moorella sulfitireducens]|uniref:SIR2 family NAD-dependent protein deacylase n=1 Tax=Neomoorella sulfitireducens TaxID=2972948 RepID=UPI0021AC1846|nr:SIR2 family protein [Moorella sulfitireducens]